VLISFRLRSFIALCGSNAQSLYLYPGRSYYMWTDAQGKDNRRWRNVAKHALKVVGACRCADSFVYKYLITQKRYAYTLRTGCPNSSNNNVCALTVHVKCTLHMQDPLLQFQNLILHRQTRVP